MVSLIHRFARRANLSQAAMLAECPRNTSRIATSRALQRGAFRDRHERWARDAMDAFGAARRTRPKADGEAVWS
jgi:hypothetical protein